MPCPSRSSWSPKQAETNDKRQNYQPWKKDAKWYMGPAVRRELCRCHLKFLYWHPALSVTGLTLPKGKLKPREEKHPCLRSLMKTQICRS